jgi:dolichyl-phosphate beta-glucosyltransferase
MFRRDAARIVFERARIDGFAFDVELLLIAEGAGLRVAEVPVAWRNDPSSRLGVVSAPVRIAWDLLRIVWRERVRRGAGRARGL